MAVRTSTVPRGKVNQSDFDAMLRSQIARTMGRGGEKDTSAIRDQLARRLNAQEGRGTSSAAYRPARNQPARAAGGRGGGGKGGRTPTPSPRPTAQALPQQIAAIPTPNPRGVPGSPDDMSWLIPAILAGLGTTSAAGRRMMGGGGGTPGTGVEAVPPQDVALRRVIDNANQGTAPLALNAPPDTKMLTYQPDIAVPPPTDINSEISRFLSNSEVEAMKQGIRPYTDIVGGATGGDVGGRYGADIVMPGDPRAVPTPGWHGSVFRQPIIRYK